MTTKLIQELVGLAVDKSCLFSMDEYGFLNIRNGGLRFSVSIDTWDKQNAPAQLQAAIDMIKEL
jgi:hypothetical protein